MHVIDAIKNNASFVILPYTLPYTALGIKPEGVWRMWVHILSLNQAYKTKQHSFGLWDVKKSFIYIRVDIEKHMSNNMCNNSKQNKSYQKLFKSMYFVTKQIIYYNFWHNDTYTAIDSHTQRNWSTIEQSDSAICANTNEIPKYWMFDCLCTF